MLCTASRFAEKFKLRQYINFKTKVEKLERCPKSGKWKVSYKRNRYSPPHRAYAAVEEENPEVISSLMTTALEVLSSRILSDCLVVSAMHGRRINQRVLFRRDRILGVS